MQSSPQDYRPENIRKFYSPINEISYDDDLMSRLQMQLLNMYRNYNNGGKFDGLQGPGNYQSDKFLLDQSKGMTEVKRHPRYRQCYFNPISSFRK